MIHCTFDRNGTLAGTLVETDANETETTPDHKWKIVGKEIWVLDVDVAVFGEKLRDVVFEKKENGDLILLSLDGESGKGKGWVNEDDDDIILEKLK